MDELFDNDLARRQLQWHQQYLVAFPSRGSSANNHTIAEAVGGLVASCAFPWFDESPRWRVRGGARLERELERNVFRCGIGRELAFDYQGFVAELALVAAVEAEAGGCPLSDAAWSRIGGLFDAIAAVVDEQGRAPRQGDGDDGRALVVDAPDAVARWRALLGLGAASVGAPSWWPEVSATVEGALLGSLCGPRPVAGGRPATAPSHFAEAGLTLLRARGAHGRPEIWCRCDGGPHGFLSIAAHAHADALSVEVRHGGVDVLADPGTYCYHGEAEWRRYFRSTLAHNTLELDGHDQSQSGGPFLWVRHAVTRLLSLEEDAEGITMWSAEHDGYTALDPPALHRRTVRLDREARRLDVVDRIEGEGTHALRLAFHLGPAVHVQLDGPAARLCWVGSGGPQSGELRLPAALVWTEHRGECEPVLGWYSPRFGCRIPATTLVGTGRCGPGPCQLRSSLQFAD